MQNSNSDGIIASWIIKDKDMIIKKCDKSFFDYSGSGVPQELRGFFDANDLSHGDKKYIKLLYNGKEYTARIHREALDLGRTRIFWESSLAREFDVFDDKDNYPSLSFKKVEKDTFEASFLNTNFSSIKKDDDQDRNLIEVLKNRTLINIEPGFEHKGEVRKKPDSINIRKHKVFPRDRRTAVNALSHAFFKCEVDNNHPTFIRRNSDKPYTEPHHLVPMEYADRFDVSLDVEENIVSLCSNCHNEIHYGRDAADLIKLLYEERKNALASVGIIVSLDELLDMYS